MFFLLPCTTTLIVLLMIKLRLITLNLSILRINLRQHYLYNRLLLMFSTKHNFSPDEVLTALSSLNVAKTAGTDGISPSILRYCALSLFTKLTIAFSPLCVSRKTFPNERKVHALFHLQERRPYFDQEL